MTKNNNPKTSKQAAQVHPALNAAFTHRRAKGNMTMTKSTRDIPTHEGSTIADRLKAARQNADKTRKALSEGTGIPASTLEKYERGDMDPNTTRLQTICDYLDVSVSWVLNGDPTALDTETTETAETQASASVAVTSTETASIGVMKSIEMAEPANENDPIDHIHRLLEALDDMRGDGFEGMQRQALAQADEVRAALKYLEPGDLLTLAYERGLHKGESCLDASAIVDLFTEDLDAGQAYCGNIEERILDTAILGSDLYTIEREALVELADELKEDHDITEPAWGGFSWGQHKDFVPLIRPIVRAMAYRGDPYDFTDQDEYPRRGE